MLRKTTLRKTMLVLATAAALTGGLSADAFARGGGGGGGGGHGGGGGGGGHMGGGFGGGGHMGGGFGGGHVGGFGGGHMGGIGAQHFAGPRGHFAHAGHFRRGLGFAPGWGDDFYGYGCSYGYYPYDPYNCYWPGY
jgi:hypothetical protein